eukprot:239326-Alexandrium_andersonii.AAC.1
MGGRKRPLLVRATAAAARAGALPLRPHVRSCGSRHAPLGRTRPRRTSRRREHRLRPCTWARPARRGGGRRAGSARRRLC